MYEYPNILIVSGSGRNTGKTGLICKIIEEFSSVEPIISVKITPHVHKSTAGLLPVSQEESFLLAKETDTSGHKDTSKFLNAGATESYIIQCNDIRVLYAFNQLLKCHPKDQVFIVESGNLKNVIKAGLSIFVTNNSNSSKALHNHINTDIILGNNVDFSDFVKGIKISEKKWLLIPYQYDFPLR